MNIASVPNELLRSKLVAMLADLGIDAENVTSDGIHISSDVVQCEVYARDASGAGLFDRARDEFATHSIAIKIVDE